MIGNIARRGNVLESPADLIAIHSWHHHVKQDEIRLLRAVGDGQRLLAIGGNLGPEKILQHPGDDGNVGWRVVDNQNELLVAGSTSVRLEVALIRQETHMRIAFTTATRECERDIECLVDILTGLYGDFDVRGMLCQCRDT